MTWRVQFLVRDHLRTALWPIPCAFGVGALLLAMVAWRVDRWLDWRLLDFQPGAAGTLGSAIVGATLTFLGTAFSVLLVVVQFASTQLTPRALRVSLNDPLYRIALGCFVATFVFSLTIVGRTTSGFVPQLGVMLAVVMVVASLAAYVVLVSHLRTSLRPVIVAGRAGLLGRRVIERLYPDPLDGHIIETSVARPAPAVESARIVCNPGPAGILVAFDVSGLVAEAGRVGGRIALVPRPGDFVRTGAVIFRLHEPSARLDDHALLGRVALGKERTLDHDPAFVLRILVDVAIKALSPAINDPTTAVMAIDQLHELLALLGARRLDIGQHRDDGGRVRLVVDMAGWEDFVSLAVDEIRNCGAGQLQVMRRLRAMLSDLLDALPGDRVQAIRTQLALVTRSVHRSFPDAEDRARAAEPDEQGIGSSPAP